MAIGPAFNNKFPPKQLWNRILDYASEKIPSTMLVSKAWLRITIASFEERLKAYQSRHSPHLNFFLARTIQTITQAPSCLIDGERYFTLSYARVKNIFQQLLREMRQMNGGSDFLDNQATASLTTFAGSAWPDTCMQSWRAQHPFHDELVIINNLPQAQLDFPLNLCANPSPRRELIQKEYNYYRRTIYESYGSHLADPLWKNFFPILNDLRATVVSDMRCHQPSLLLAPRLDAIATKLLEDQANNLVLFFICGIGYDCPQAWEYYQTLPDAEDNSAIEKARLIRVWIGDNIELIRTFIGNRLKIDPARIDRGFLDQMTSLPEEIGLLTQLEELDLAGLSLTSLPASFSQLTQLQTLKLNENKFETFPEVLYKLPNLKILLFSDTYLTKSPDMEKFERAIRGDLTFREWLRYDFEGNPFVGAKNEIYRSSKVHTSIYPLLRDLTNWSDNHPKTPPFVRVLKRIACFFGLLIAPVLGFLEAFARAFTFSLFLCAVPFFFCLYGLKGWKKFYDVDDLAYKISHAIWPIIGLSLTAFNLFARNLAGHKLNLAQAEGAVEACLPNRWNIQGWRPTNCSHRNLPLAFWG